MFCPNCGQQNVQPGDASPNGGELFVAEEMEGVVEFYDSAKPYRCADCETQFYLGGE
jgi:hypothetical protein